MSRQPQEKARCTRHQSREFSQGRLFRRVNREHHIGYLERDGVALEEIGHVDQPLATFCIGIGNELVVGEWEAEYVRVHDDDPARVGSVADHVGVEAVQCFFFALGLAGVDGALCEVGALVYLKAVA